MLYATGSEMIQSGENKWVGKQMWISFRNPWNNLCLTQEEIDMKVGPRCICVSAGVI